MSLPNISESIKAILHHYQYSGEYPSGIILIPITSSSQDHQSLPITSESSNQVHDNSQGSNQHRDEEMYDKESDLIPFQEEISFSNNICSKDASDERKTCRS